MQKFLAIIVIASTLALSGCTGVGLTFLGVGTGTAASAGVNHTLSGIAYKTFTETSANVHRATLTALSEMGMKVEEERKIENGAVVTASATDRNIEIEFERLTLKTTRMRVTVKESNGIFRDSATATEIIIQTATALEGQVATKEKSQRTASRPKK